MKNNYINPQAEFIAILTTDVITASLVDDHSGDIFDDVSNKIPFLK